MKNPLWSEVCLMASVLAVSAFAGVTRESDTAFQTRAKAIYPNRLTTGQAGGSALEPVEQDRVDATAAIPASTP